MYIASEEDLEKFVSEIRELLDSQVEDIILYGSYAREEHTPGSDIDILILVSDSEDIDRRKVSEVAGRYFTEENLLFSPLIMEKEEYEKKLEENYTFHRNVDEEGVKL